MPVCVPLPVSVPLLWVLIPPADTAAVAVAVAVVVAVVAVAAVVTDGGDMVYVKLIVSIPQFRLAVPSNVRPSVELLLVAGGPTKK
jgi:hypothetical protein